MEQRSRDERWKRRRGRCSCHWGLGENPAVAGVAVQDDATTQPADTSPDEMGWGWGWGKREVGRGMEGGLSSRSRGKTKRNTTPMDEPLASDSNAGVFRRRSDANVWLKSRLETGRGKLRVRGLMDERRNAMLSKRVEEEEQEEGKEERTRSQVPRVDTAREAGKLVNLPVQMLRKRRATSTLDMENLEQLAQAAMGKQAGWQWRGLSQGLKEGNMTGKRLAAKLSRRAHGPHVPRLHCICQPAGASPGRASCSLGSRRPGAPERVWKRTWTAPAFRACVQVSCCLASDAPTDSSRRFASHNRLTQSHTSDAESCALSSVASAIA
ncbi:hypothetical protein MBR_08375, partial [Metarhizium brunneum ARSEF 3297]